MFFKKKKIKNQKKIIATNGLKSLFVFFIALFFFEDA
jgi:hypothetical protein